MKTVSRDELRHLVDELPDEQLSAAFALVRQLSPAEANSDPDEAESEWPPAWFSSISSGRDDTSEQVDEILRAEYGRPG